MTIRRLEYGTWTQESRWNGCNTVCTVFRLRDSRLASGGYKNKRSKISNTPTMTFEMTLHDRTEIIRQACELSDGQLWNVSYVKTIKVWETQSQKCTMTIQGREDDLYYCNVYSKPIVKFPSRGTRYIAVWKVFLLVVGTIAENCFELIIISLKYTI